MKAFITLDVHWIQEPSKTLVYYFLVNGFEKEYTSPTKQICFWDPQPCLQGFTIEIVAEKKSTVGLLGKTETSAILDRSSQRFYRLLNQKLSYTPETLSISNYVTVSTVTCSVSGFVYPEWDPLTKTSLLQFVQASSAIEVTHLSSYFREYNRGKLLYLADNPEKSFNGYATLLRIKNIGPNMVIESDDDQMVFPIFYEFFIVKISDYVNKYREDLNNSDPENLTKNKTKKLDSDLKSSTTIDKDNKDKPPKSNYIDLLGDLVLDVNEAVANRY